MLILGSSNTFQASWIISEYTFLIFPPKGKALAYEQQTYFRREATTGNTSAVRRLAKLRLLRENFQKDSVGLEAFHSLCNTL